jgi:transcriptional regulator with XRE-family HTH domain
MIPILTSSEDILHLVSTKAKSLRLSAEMTQAELAARAGVSLASLRRFEQIGEASFQLVARIALALRAEEGFGALFDLPTFSSLDEAMGRTVVRQRGRRKAKREPK